jgi:hypothetical protein
MTVKIPTLLSLFLAAAVPAGAAEIDSLTGRQRELRDATGALDSRVNGYLRRAVERANARGRGCNEELLYFEIRRAVASPFVGHVLAEELGDAEGLDRSHVALDESIYRDLGMFDAISVHLKNLSAVVEMDGNRIGLDKFGHFFAQGWKYFDRAYRNGSEGGDESGGGDEHGIEAALAWGERTERTYYGFYTTGIYSHADLAANFDGMRFWLRVLGHGDDPQARGAHGALRERRLGRGRQLLALPQSHPGVAGGGARRRARGSGGEPLHLPDHPGRVRPGARALRALRRAAPAPALPRRRAGTATALVVLVGRRVPPQQCLCFFFWMMRW